MAEQPVAQEAKQEIKPPSVADQYDIGETDHVINDPSASAASGVDQTPEVVGDGPLESAPAEESAQPARQPDGRFAPKTYKHAHITARLAADHGLEQEYIDSTPPEVLDQVVYRLEKQYKDLMRENGREAVLTRQPQAQEPAQPQQPTDSYDAIDVDPEQFEPWVPATIKAIKELRKEVAELKAAKNHLVQAEQTRQQTALQRQVDKAFSNYEDVLGKGGRHEIEDGGAFHRRRIAVLNEASADKGQGTLEQKIARAVEALYGKPQPAKTQAAKPSPMEEAWQTGSLARPTHRASEDAPGVKKATRSVARMLNGASADSHIEPDSLDDFLGN